LVGRLHVVLCDGSAAVGYYVKYLDDVEIGQSAVEFGSDGMSRPNSCDEAVKFSLTTISCGENFF